MAKIMYTGITKNKENQTHGNTPFQSIPRMITLPNDKNTNSVVAHTTEMNGTMWKENLKGISVFVYLYKYAKFNS
jgi:hypothetical protein